MSREIDERIVAMYFDNRNFESGAQQTLKTLEQLKQSCNMEGVGKGFEAIGEVSKTMKLDKITQGISKMKTAFNGVGNIIKKAFSLTPFDNMLHALNNFRHNFLDKIIGFDIAGKLASSIENALRSLTIAPVSAGWQQYENTMDSIKTIMSSTGENIDVVKAKLGEMTDYANQTIYSLNDMTSNLGKFTNNGVKLDDATNAMIGLANATADAGQGAQQASMAMYNVSQAIGVGKMTTIDWKSLENANIATQKLKRTFIQAAVASGDLEEKVVKVKDATTGLEKEETQYWTKAQKGAKAEQVTVENFRETLNKGWLTKKAMLDTFAIYSGQMDADAIASLGFSRKQAEELALIGQEALKAAQEVRTFSKMMDAARESVQSSWATSFEFIFGDMQEGTNLWTDLNKKIDDILTKGAEARNNILMSWRGLMKDENGQVRKIEDVYKSRKQSIEHDRQMGYINEDTYNRRMEYLENTLGNTDLWVDYREVAISTFMDLFDTVKMVAGQVKGAWEDVFGSFTSDTLKGLTTRIRGVVSAIREWLGSSSDAESRISKLRKGLTGVFNVLKVGWNVLKTVVSAGWNMIKPFLDPILNLFEMFGKAMDLTGANNLSDIIKRLSDRFKNLVKTVKELGWSGVMGKVGNWFSDIWQKMKSGIKGWLTDNGFGGVIEWFKNIRSKLEEGINTVKEWWENPDNKVAGFFKGIWDSIMSWFTPSDEGDIPIVSFFTGIYTKITTAWDSVFGEEGSLTKWWNGGDNAVANFFKNVWESISGVFTSVDGKDAPIVAFFKNIYDKITTAWDSVFGEEGSLTKWWNGGDNAVANFFSDVWTAVSGVFISTDGKDAPIVEFFTGIYGKIVEAWNSIFGESGLLTKWWNGGDNAVANFFSDVWESVSGVFESADGEDAPIVKFFKSIPGALSEAWKSITKWFKDNGITKFFTDAWNWLMEAIGVKPGDTGVSDKNLSSMARNPLNQIADAGISDSGSMKRLVDNTVGGTDEFEKELDKKVEELPIVQFFNKIKTALMNAWEGITGWEGWTAIGDFFNRTLQWLSGLFTGASGNDDSTEVDANLERKRNLLDSIGSFLKGTIEALADMVREIGTADTAKDVFGTIGDIVVAVTDIISVLAEWASKIAHGLKTGDWNLNIMDWLIPLLAIIGMIGKTIVDIKKNSDLAKIAEAKGSMSGFGTQILQFAGAIALIAVAVSVIGKLDLATLGKAVGTIVLIGVVMFALLQAVNKLGDTLNLGFKNQPVTTTERVLKHLITSVTVAGAIAETLALLPSILDKLKDFKGDTNGDAILKTFEGIALTIASLILSIAIFNKLSSGRADVKSTAMSALGIVAGLGILLIGLDAIIGSLFGLGEAVKNIDPKNLGGITEDHIKRIKAGGEILAALGEALGGFLGAIGGGLIGGFSRAKSNQDSLALKDAAAILSDISIEDMNHMAEVVGVLSDIQDAIPDYEGIWDKWLNGDKLGQLGDNVGRLGVGLGTMVREINPADLDPTNDISRLKGYTEFLSGFGSVLQALYNSVLQANQFDDSFYGSIGLMTNSVVPLYAEAARQLSEAVQAGLGEEGMEAISAFQFDATGIVTAICRSLEQNGSKKISTAVRNMINEGLKEYGGVNEFGNPNIHSTEQIDKSLETIFSHMTQNGGSLGFSGVLSSFLGEFTDQTKINELLGGLDFTYLGDIISDKINGSINIDMSKWTETDDQGNLVMMKNLEDQWTEMLSKYDELGGKDLEIQIRPVLNMDGFGTEMFKLRGALSNELPLNMKTTIDIGDQTLPIDDTNIVAEIRSVRTELQTASAALQRVLWAVDNSLGSKINGVTSAVSRLKLNVSLKQIDDGLGRSASNSALTGVSAPWDMDLAAPHAIP